MAATTVEIVVWVTLLVGGVATTSEIGDFRLYGWAPENRASDVPWDDYRIVRMFDTTDVRGTFEETISLLPTTSTGIADQGQGIGFKRYGISTDPNYMVTVRVTNNGRCPVYMALLGFAEEGLRDITGKNNDFWDGTDPNDEGSSRYRQPFYKMHRGAFTNEGGMGGSVTTATTNWFLNINSETETIGPTKQTFTFFDGKFVDGQDVDSNFTQISRLPVSFDPQTQTCSEMPSRTMKYFALDVAHITDTANPSNIDFQRFPGAFDDQGLYQGCTTDLGQAAANSANVTVTIRFADVRLIPVGLVEPERVIVYPHANPPRKLAQAIVVSADTNIDRFKYAGDITITRAAPEDEVYIDEYVVYSVYVESGNVFKCTGREFIVFNKTECEDNPNIAEPTENERRCRRTILPTDVREEDAFQDELNPETASKNCQNFAVISRNSFGEDSLIWYNNVVSQPRVAFTDNDGSKMVTPQDRDGEIEVTANSKRRTPDDLGPLARATPSREPSRTAPPPRQGTRGYSDSPNEQNGQHKGAESKFVTAGNAVIQWETSPEGGVQMRRTITGQLENQYLENIPDIEEDGDMMGGAFNVPYHRWLFSPSDMSSWEITVFNDVRTLFQEIGSLGLTGFAVMPADYCISKNLNGSVYDDPVTIKALCEEDPDDDLMWFDLTESNTNVWSESCFSQPGKQYQILLGVRTGFRARYQLVMKYQDFNTQVQTLNGGKTKRFRGCIKSGQHRDFSIDFPASSSILTASIIEGVDVDGIYVAPGSSPATQVNQVAFDTYLPGWSRTLSASQPCAGGTVSNEPGTWHVRVFKLDQSPLSDDLVEFVIELDLATNNVPVVADTNPNNDIEFLPGNFSGYISNGELHVYRIDVPGSQQLTVRVEQLSGLLEAVLLQRGSCPSRQLMRCSASSEDQLCYADFAADANGVFVVQPDPSTIVDEETSWYLAVVATSRLSGQLIDEATFRVHYEFLPEPPPSPTVEPSIEPCNRFTFFCGEEFLEAAAPTTSSLVAALLGVGCALVVTLLQGLPL